MTKINTILISICVTVVFSNCTLAAPESVEHEPSFQIENSQTKHISNSNLENALSNHSLDQMGHGFIILAIVGLLTAARKL